MKFLLKVLKIIAKLVVILVIIMIAMSFWGHSRVDSGATYLRGSGYTSVAFDDVTYDWNCDGAAYLYDVIGSDGVPKQVALCLPVGGEIALAKKD